MKKLNLNKLATLSTAEMLLSRKYGNLGSSQRMEFDAASRDWYDNQCAMVNSPILGAPQSQMAMV
ncbi:MAG: hypothetical protein MJZ53_03665 [Paludibacteraceae bacterium]|nr:hypothetical protein [Paludibacteraceae bacterium]